MAALLLVDTFSWRVPTPSDHTSNTRFVVADVMLLKSPGLDGHEKTEFQIRFDFKGTEIFERHGMTHANIKQITARMDIRTYTVYTCCIL